MFTKRVIRRHTRYALTVLFCLVIPVFIFSSDLMAVFGNDFLKWRLMLFAETFSSGKITDWWWAEQDVIPLAANNSITIQYADGSEVVLDRVRPFDFIIARHVLISRINDIEIDYATDKYVLLPLDFGCNGLYKDKVVINGLHEIKKKMNVLEAIASSFPTQPMIFTTTVNRVQTIHHLSQERKQEASGGVREKNQKNQGLSRKAPW